jgi:hypothetical protein
MSSTAKIEASLCNARAGFGTEDKAANSTTLPESTLHLDP